MKKILLYGIALFVSLFVSISWAQSRPRCTMFHRVPGASCNLKKMTLTECMVKIPPSLCTSYCQSIGCPQDEGAAAKPEERGKMLFLMCKCQ